MYFDILTVKTPTYYLDNVIHLRKNCFALLIFGHLRPKVQRLRGTPG